jgi:phage terminase small subunit
MRDPREARFIQEYLLDLNAAGAARRAGYSAHTATEQGYELLSKPHVQAQVALAEAERAERTQITAEKALVEIARLAFVDATRIFADDGTLLPVQDWPIAVKKAVTALKVRTDATGAQILEVKFADKGKMLTLLARHLGLISDRRDAPMDISDLLKSVLLEMQEREGSAARTATPEAEWAPLPPAPRAHGHHHALPAPPGVDDDA